jgi:hypothetical protein
VYNTVYGELHKGIEENPAWANPRARGYYPKTYMGTYFKRGITNMKLSPPLLICYRLVLCAMHKESPTIYALAEKALAYLEWAAQFGFVVNLVPG